MIPSKIFSEICPESRCRGTSSGQTYTGYMIPIMNTKNYIDRQGRRRQLLVNGGCACVAVTHLSRCVDYLWKSHGINFNLCNDQRTLSQILLLPLHVECIDARWLTKITFFKLYWSYLLLFICIYISQHFIFYITMTGYFLIYIFIHMHLCVDQ